MRADKKDNPKFYEKVSNAWTTDSIWLFNSTNFQDKTSFFYAQEYGEFKTFYPFFTNRSNLSSYYIHYTISGKGKLEYKGHEFVLTPGTCFFIDCELPHKYTTDKGDKWHFAWLHFNGTHAEKYYQTFIDNGKNVVTIDNRESFLTKLFNVKKQIEKSDPLTPFIISSEIAGILSDLLLNQMMPVLPINYPSHIAGCLSYIEENLFEDIYLDDLASSVFVSKFFLCHEFKKYLGTPIAKYITNKRIDFAKQMLKQTDISVEKIASTVNMSNTSHFINIFNKMTGLTPNQYRLSWK